MFMSVGNIALAKLHDEGLLLEPPVDFAEDRLVVLVQEGNPLGIERFEDIAGENVETVAIAKAKSAPGHFAEMALKRAGLYEQLEDRFVRPDQPAMLKGFVTQEKADLAVMLLTCATKEAAMGEEPAAGVPNAEIALEVPHKYYDRLTCQIGIMKDTADPELARRFAAFLQEKHPQEILADWDFFPCEPGPEDASADSGTPTT
jgi:molybdate transport system substrate-binding protein